LSKMCFILGSCAVITIAKQDYITGNGRMGHSAGAALNMRANGWHQPPPDENHTLDGANGQHTVRWKIAPTGRSAACCVGPR